MQGGVGVATEGCVVRDVRSSAELKFRFLPARFLSGLWIAWSGIDAGIDRAIEWSACALIQVISVSADVDGVERSCSVTSSARRFEDEISTLYIQKRIDGETDQRASFLNERHTRREYRHTESYKHSRRLRAE